MIHEGRSSRAKVFIQLRIINEHTTITIPKTHKTQSLKKHPPFFPVHGSIYLSLPPNSPRYTCPEGLEIQPFTRGSNDTRFSSSSPNNTSLQNSLQKYSPSLVSLHQNRFCMQSIHQRTKLYDKSNAM